jgi:hypothetical protein
MRDFAMEFAEMGQLGPRGWAESKVGKAVLADALELGSRCGREASVPKEKERGAEIVRTQHTVRPRSTIFVVGGEEGDDFRTVKEALDAVKTANTTAIHLRGDGTTHYITSPLTLTPAHNGLTISTRPGDDAPGTISGGVLIPKTMVWTPHDVSGGKNIWVADLSSLQLKDVPGLRLDGDRVVRARTPNGNPETNGLHTSPSGWVCGALIFDIYFHSRFFHWSRSHACLLEALACVRPMAFLSGVPLLPVDTANSIETLKVHGQCSRVVARNCCWPSSR